MNNTQDIITAFELFIGDETELSDVEELALCQKVYNEILEEAEWEFLKKEQTGTLSGTDIPQPADFNSLTNKQTVFIGASNTKYAVVPYDDRRAYQDKAGYFYYDARLEKLVSTFNVNDTYSFDYIMIPPALDVSGSNPVFPIRFYDMIYHKMCCNADIINLSDKARSYAAENLKEYQNILTNMKLWNSKISSRKNYGV